MNSASTLVPCARRLQCTAFDYTEWAKKVTPMSHAIYHFIKYWPIFTSAIASQAMQALVARGDVHPSVCPSATLRYCIPSFQLGTVTLAGGKSCRVSVRAINRSTQPRPGPAPSFGQCGRPPSPPMSAWICHCLYAFCPFS